MHVDPRALGCVAYAAAGQKWLCGADGTGFLWIDPAFAEQVAPVTPGYVSFEDASAGLEGTFKDTAARYDTPSLSREAVALSLAAAEVLEAAGWEELHSRAVAQARRLADALRERGRAVMPRGATTLVAWEDPFAEQTRDRLAGAGVVVRDLPGRSLVRASVGAWNDDADLERLLSASSDGSAPERRIRSPIPTCSLSMRWGYIGGGPARRLEPLALLGLQPQPVGAEQVLELLERARPDDRRGDAVRAEQPRERDLGDRDAARLGDLPRRVDDREVALDRAPLVGLLVVVSSRRRSGCPPAGARRAGSCRSGSRRRAGPTGSRRGRRRGRTAAARARSSARRASTAAAARRTATSPRGPAARPPRRAARPGSSTRRARAPCRRARARRAPRACPRAARRDRARGPGRGRSRRRRAGAGSRRTP